MLVALASLLCARCVVGNIALAAVAAAPASLELIALLCAPLPQQQPPPKPQQPQSMLQSLQTPPFYHLQQQQQQQQQQLADPMSLTCHEEMPASPARKIPATHSAMLAATTAGAALLLQSQDDSLYSDSDDSDSDKDSSDGCGEWWVRRVVAAAHVSSLVRPSVRLHLHSFDSLTVRGARNKYCPVSRALPRCLFVCFRTIQRAIRLHPLGTLCGAPAPSPKSVVAGVTATARS